MRGTSSGLALSVALVVAPTAAAAPCDYARAPYRVENLTLQADQSTKEYFSPDSKRIVFGEGGRIKVYDIASREVSATLTQAIGARWPSWTRDGKIFFEAQTPPPGENAAKPPRDPPPTFLMNEDGSNRTEVDTSALPRGDESRSYRAGNNGYFKVSEDGRRVTFNYGPNATSVSPNNSFWIYVADVVYVAGGKARFVNPKRVSYDTSYWSEGKGWSGDASKVVFASTRGEEGDRRAVNSDSYALDPENGRVYRLTHAPTWEEAADVLRGDLGPGDAITFISDRDTPNPEQGSYGAGGVLPVFEENRADWALVAGAAVPLATWTSHEIFVAGHRGDRGWLRRLTFGYDEAGWNSRGPKWSPDGTMISFLEDAGSAQAKAQERAGAREQTFKLIRFDCPAAASRRPRARLALRLRHHRGRRCAVRVTVTGADRGLIRRVEFRLGGRVARDRRAPFSRQIPSRGVRRVRARVRLGDGRLVTLSRRVRACGR